MKRAVVLSVEYHIKGLKVNMEGNTGVSMQIVTDLDIEQVVMRKVSGNGGGEESDSSVFYPDEEDIKDTD